MTGRYCSLAQQSAPAFTAGLTAERLGALIGGRSMWVNGTVLHYCFFDGDSDGSVIPVPGTGTVRRVSWIGRVDVSESASDSQPRMWTFVEWEADGEDVDGLAQAFAEALEPADGWYADFVAGEERVVVFAGKVFRYRRGDEAGRAEAVAYGRSVGTPEHQLDRKE